MQRQTHTPAADVARLADRQHGVIARRQLLAIGVQAGAIAWRLRTGRLHLIHRGVYAVGHRSLSRRGHWLAAVLAHGDGAVLSHRSAAALWGLLDPPLFPVDVTASRGRNGRERIRLHRATVRREEVRIRHAIPLTSVSRTLLDLAEVVDEVRLRRAFEQADRLRLLKQWELDATCARSHGRRGLGPILRLIAESRTGATRSALEDSFVAFCRDRRLPLPQINATLLGHEVDALWPAQRLIVELDGFAFHSHRAAFERDRARDAALQAAGYRVVRLTDRRLRADPAGVITELRALLG